MTSKLLEIRDRATFIPILAIRLDPICEEERYLLARSGYGLTYGEQDRYVLLCQIAGGGLGHCASDPFTWTGSRTYHIAHRYIIEHFANLTSGDVVDVQFILGETDKPKVSEREKTFV